MKLAPSLTSLFDRLPPSQHRSSHEDKIELLETALTQEAENLPPEIEARYLLADSIDKLHDASASPAQRQAIQHIVEEDAERLAHIIQRRAHYAAEHPLFEQDMPEKEVITDKELIPPTLPEVMLLARAYDVTLDPKVGSALADILATAPPAFSRQLTDALRRAKAHRSSVMDEFQQAAAYADIRLNRPPDATALQYILNLRDAAGVDPRILDEEERNHTRFIGPERPDQSFNQS